MSKAISNDHRVYKFELYSNDKSVEDSKLCQIKWEYNMYLSLQEMYHVK